MSLALSAAAAQEAPAPPPAAEMRAASAVAVGSANARKLHAAFDYLYNLDFGPALQLFEEVSNAEPDSAAATAFWSSALLYEILAHQGSLQSQLFVTTNEFLRYPRLPVDPKLDARFHRVSEEAEQRAKRRLKDNPADVDGLFALGLIYGSQANYLAGVKAEYFRGVRLGEKANDIHLKLRAAHPELHDTGIVLGVRQYVIGILPRTTRFFLFFVGARGSRDRGMEYLRETADRGEYLRTYAKILLSVAAIRDKDLDTAVALGEELVGRYPRNPLFRLEITRLYRERQRYEEATRLARDLLAELAAHPHNPRVVGPEDALLELGLIEAGQGKLDLALESLRRVGIFPGASKHTQAEAMLERGKIFDARGQRELAVAEYDKVIRLSADPASVRAAQSYRKRPYQPSEDSPSS
ncbi:MAG: tetratricopeptide repeat protein [Candidatus Acidiferrales bacterium]